MVELNEAQQRAVSAGDPSILVMAGAGTGKTATLIARCAALIEQGIDPQTIQALTFTRRSAEEIRTRVRAEIGPRAKRLGASTFHSWCMSMLRGNEEAWGYSGWTVIDIEDQGTLFKAARGTRSKNFPKSGEIQSSYSFARNTKQSLTDVVTDRFMITSDDISKIGTICRTYEAKKHSNSYLDYDDILIIVGQQLRRSAELARWLASRFRYLLVDEFQDTNPIQWDILEPLIPHLNTFCVGDDAQSIYGFRGADFEMIHSFTQRVEGAKRINLDVNYRSKQEILDLSNWLLGESPLHYDKHLIAHRGSGQKPEVYDFLTDVEEASWVVDEIEAEHEAGMPLSENLILARSAWKSRPVESELLKRGIPYRYYGGQKLLESAHIRDVLALLKIVANPLDELAWLRFLQLLPKIGEVSANSIFESQLNVVRSTGKIEPQWLPESANKAVVDVLNAQTDVSAAIAAAVEHLAPHLERKYLHQHWDRRKSDFQVLTDLARGHDSIAGFIEQYLLSPVYGAALDPVKPETDPVTLSTIHSAKGMEANTVYVVACGPGNWPTARAASDDDHIEEERRVLYVALTRARDRLALTRTIRSKVVETATKVNDPYLLADVPEDLWEQQSMANLATPMPPAPITLGQVNLGVEL